ncbi:MAG TPA: hypothetical protein VFJ07_12875 [Streptosporangiaceae bacterium]|nr:hypothetical protein [Streptosporangiaceae bacterium]
MRSNLNATLKGAVTPANPITKLRTRPPAGPAATIAAGAATAGMLLAQDQVNTTNPAKFDYLYSNSRTHTQAASPQILTNAEISTTYGTASQIATTAKPAHAHGSYINATSNILSKIKTFPRTMQAAGC